MFFSIQNQVDVGRILLDNVLLIYNLISVAIGIFVGMFIRRRFMNADKKGNSFLDFAFFFLVLGYGVVVATFSNAPIPFWGYFLIGMAVPPSVVPLYKAAIASAPQLLGTFIPDWLKKWILEHTSPPTSAPPVLIEPPAIIKPEGEQTNG